jgi:signal transduction histidine kinase
MNSLTKKPDEYGNLDEHFDDMRFRVTRNFCIFCFALALLAIPSSSFAKDRTTLIINSIGVFFYVIPMVIALKPGRYTLAAKCFICVAMTATFINAVAANLDISLPTTVWYFVYLVFAHLVLNLSWAIAVGGMGLVSVTIFSVLRHMGLNRVNPNLMDNSLVVGSPIALFVAFIALLYLLTVYKRLRDEMVKKLLESNREKNQLVGIMSHDLRNYLGVINPISSIIRDTMKDCTDQQIARETISNLTLVEQASSQAMKMVTEVLEVTRNEAEKMIFLEEKEITSFIAPIFQRYEVLARSKGVRFVMATDSAQAMVAINKDKFSRVIENLLSNATKFTRHGDTVTVSTRCSGRTVVIAVADTGIGIPADIQEKVFEPFTKAGRSGTANEKSIGLGLSIVKKIVHAHGGTIRFESENGKGTTFSIQLAAVVNGGRSR